MKIGGKWKRGKVREIDGRKVKLMQKKGKWRLK
jgi:hypothetical protein